MEKPKKGVYNHVLRYTGLFGGVQGWVLLMSLIRNKFAAVWLGSVGIGLIDLYNRTLNLFSALTQWVVPAAAVRALSLAYEGGNGEEMEEQVMVVRSWAVLTSLIGMALCILGAPWLSQLTYGTYSRWFHFVLLSPIIPLVAISGTELSILKAMRRLKNVAWASCWGALMLALLTIPFYIWLGIRGVVPALLCSTAAQVAVQLRYTLPLMPWRVKPFSLSLLKKGKGLVRFSIFYIAGSIVAAGSEYAIRYIMGNWGNVGEIGLYSSGVMLTVAAGHFIFFAMDADYYPRLSACSLQRNKMNLTVNRQLEVSVLLLAPFLVFFDVCMPFVIRLLLTPAFLQVVSMVVLATFYMFFKAATTPVAYIALARADGRTFFVMETCYYVVFVLLIGTGFHVGGIPGTGLALSLAGLFDFTMITWVYHHQYGFRFSRQAVQTIAIQGALVLLGILTCMMCTGWLLYAGGVLWGLVSLGYSLRVLSQRSSLKEILRFHRSVESGE